jgi:hypothetical protein
MGYGSQNSAQSNQGRAGTVVPTTMSLRFNMRSVTTALAVNLGILKLDSLVNVAADQVRVQMLDTMVQYGYISRLTASSTSSYFDPFYSPLPNIYCTSYKKAPPQCKPALNKRGILTSPRLIFAHWSLVQCMIPSHTHTLTHSAL